MGPNLKRLFDRLPQRPLDIVHDEDGEVNDIIDAHGKSLPGSADEAKIIVMLANHGEALIEALEEALDSFKCTQVVQDYPEDHWAPKAQQLLARLESEAQP